MPGQTVTKNITGVIKEELNLTRADTVIVKMDIEWAEWTVLPGIPLGDHKCFPSAFKVGK